jgi:hypothetical protein
MVLTEAGSVVLVLVVGAPQPKSTSKIKTKRDKLSTSLSLLAAGDTLVVVIELPLLNCFTLSLAQNYNILARLSQDNEAYGKILTGIPLY